MRACAYESPTVKSPLPFFLLLLASHAASAAVDFVRDIQPIFSEHCYQCHGPHKQEAAFRLDHKPSALKGGDFGIAIVPGKADDSRLMHAVLGTNPKMRMPRKGDPLSADEIAKLKAWIDAGAVWPDSASVKLEQKTDHWAFKPPVKPKVPAKAKHPIDAFIRERLAKEGLQPSPAASPETLMRRLFHLDLTGLPPTPKETSMPLPSLMTTDPDQASADLQPARLPALRRTLGASLARRRTLRRQQRL